MDSKKLEPFELLEAGRTDVIFAARQSRVNCDWTPLYYDAMYAILPEDYPVGGRESFPIEMATGKQAYFCGKPNPLMMRMGLKMLSCHSAEAVMVGDRMDTDVISGMESGMSTVLVLSGVSTRETLRTYAYRPSIVLDGVGDIAAMARAEKK